MLMDCDNFLSLDQRKGEKTVNVEKKEKEKKEGSSIEEDDRKTRVNLNMLDDVISRASD